MVQALCSVCFARPKLPGSARCPDCSHNPTERGSRPPLPKWDKPPRQRPRAGAMLKLSFQPDDDPDEWSDDEW